MSEGYPTMKEILQKTISVSRELDALEREHRRFLSSSAKANAPLEILSGEFTRMAHLIVYVHLGSAMGG